MFDLYSGILKMNDNFYDDGEDITIRYLLNSDYQSLCESYKLYDIAGDKDDFNKAENLLEWISSNIYHFGSYDNHIKNTAEKLFEYSFGKGAENGINCRSLSLALTECLLAVGIKARTIYIMPLSPYDFDNHVVCEAWISKLNKWVMFDPTYNLYATYNDNPLSIIELRRLLADQEEVIFNAEAHYNGTPINKEEIITYYSKNLFRFMFTDIQGADSENIDGRKFVNVTPIGYDVKTFTLANIDFRIKKWGDNENMQNWRKYVHEDKLIYKGLDVLY